LQHVRRDAARCAGLSATADPCSFLSRKRSYTEFDTDILPVCLSVRLHCILTNEWIAKKPTLHDSLGTTKTFVKF